MKLSVISESFIKTITMKTLNNNVILYDEDCPLCQAYTSGFIKTKMLDNTGRKSFSKITSEEQKFIDINRASNEIALVDTNNKTVIYGIDSLLKVIGFSFPWIEKIGQLKPIKYSLKKLYSFISYNRKVIIPSTVNKDLKTQCIPSFNLKYRLLYILFSVFITTLILFNFSKSLTFLPEYSILRELILTFGQILFQTAFLIKLSKKNILNYIGNLMTVSLFGALILIPIVCIKQLITIPKIVVLGWFGITVGIMFLEHYRRVKLLKLPNYLTYTWGIYRLIMLLIILK